MDLQGWIRQQGWVKTWQGILALVCLSLATGMLLFLMAKVAITGNDPHVAQCITTETQAGASFDLAVWRCR